ncbi:MAG: tetratricopeptide repeat protein [Candidatus Rokuibacteriota bacterium]
MRAAAAIVMLFCTAGAAGAQSPLAAEVRALADRYHETTARIDTLRPAMAQAAQADLDPRFPPAYVLAGTVYYEVPGLFGGDLEKSEQLFRKGLEVDGRHSGLRVGLARTLIKRGRIPEARRELQAVLEEKAPSNVADWTLKDSREARGLLDSLPARP